MKYWWPIVNDKTEIALVDSTHHFWIVGLQTAVPRTRTWRMDAGGLKSSTITASSTRRSAARRRTDDVGLLNQNLPSLKRYQRLPRRGVCVGDTEATCALRPVSPRNASTSNDALSTFSKLGHCDVEVSPIRRDGGTLRQSPSLPYSSAAMVGGPISIRSPRDALLSSPQSRDLDRCPRETVPDATGRPFQVETGQGRGPVRWHKTARRRTTTVENSTR